MLAQVIEVLDKGDGDWEATGVGLEPVERLEGQFAGFGPANVAGAHFNPSQFLVLAKNPPAASLRSAKPDKDSAVKYLSDVFDWCAGVLSGLTQADLDKVYPGPNNAPGMSGWDLVMNVFIHTAHHRGYADVYLREKGITPPTYAV